MHSSEGSKNNFMGYEGTTHCSQVTISLQCVLVTSLGQWTLVTLVLDCQTNLVEWPCVWRLKSLTVKRH